jgi:putative FmdB family regulatory protein
MPTYDYECQECGHRFEVYHPATEKVENCERCSGPVRRVFHPVGIIFRGSGFHCTDYARDRGNGDKSEDKVGEGTADKAKSGSSK